MEYEHKEDYTSTGAYQGFFTNFNQIYEFTFVILANRDANITNLGPELTKRIEDIMKTGLKLVRDLSVGFPEEIVRQEPVSELIKKAGLLVKFS
ncbi:hypothetical protein J4423_01245 [Candidatus Pacearchaeota archaeon]|nr:hypothetical protein [Candidatus Pacearchaeota archaeon]